MAALATSATVPLPQPLIDTKFVVRFFTLSHKSPPSFQAEKISRLTGRSQVPREIEDAVRNVLDDDGKRHHKGAKCIVKWIQSLESGRVESALDYLIHTKAHERFARFFTHGPTDVQVGYWYTAGLIVLLIADLPTSLSSCSPVYSSASSRAEMPTTQTRQYARTSPAFV